MDSDEIADSVTTVRRASLADSDGLASLRWSWRVGERGERAVSQEEFRARFRRWMSEHEHTHQAFVAEFAGSLVGMAWLAVITRVPGPEIWDRRSGSLQSVYVLPSHRGHGIGGQLVIAAVSAGRELGLDYLAVHPSERSFPLYRRLGFGDAPGVLEMRLRPRRPAAP